MIIPCLLYFLFLALVVPYSSRNNEHKMIIIGRDKREDEIEAKIHQREGHDKD